MKYDMIFRFFPESAEDLNGLVALDDRLTRALAPVHVVYNHDLCSRYLNLSFYTDDPAAALSLARIALSAGRMSETLQAGYREIGGTTYRQILPGGDTRPSGEGSPDNG